MLPGTLLDKRFRASMRRRGRPLSTNGIIELLLGLSRGKRVSKGEMAVICEPAEAIATPPPMRLVNWPVVWALIAGIAGACDARAGGSAETTLVVINAASPISLQVANEYARLRGIPDTHLVRLSDVPSFGALPVADFRRKALAPIRDFIREHKLEEEIDLVAYSSDFPYAVDFKSDVKDHNLPANRLRGDTASLTGLTYFANRVEARDTGYLGVNHYFVEFAGRRQLPAGEAAGSAASMDDQVLPAPSAVTYGPFENTHGFRHRYAWSNSDLAVWQPKDVLDQYYLSAMLAYTGVRGNSFPEIAGYLGRAGASDGTNPDGMVYLMANDNVRSRTRQPLFPATLSELARRGRKGEILGPKRDRQKGIIPLGRDDVIGAVVGTREFDWEKSNSRLLPGAVAESLTSYGGHFDYSGQTKLTAFLRHGAAGSSGAVAEPFALQQKFPVPLLHAYYADGCSLAEAFYQSVLTPYQLLVVGDPLARPFARFAEVGLETPDVGSAWSGTVRLEPLVRPADGTSIRVVELWVDGQHVASGALNAPIAWDTRSVEDGSHDLRLVAVEDSVIETRSVFRATVSVFNRERRVHVEAVTGDVRYGEAVALRGRAEGAERVELRRGHQVLGTAEVMEGRWSLTVPSGALGMGTVPVVVRAAYPDGHAVRSAPVPIVVRGPALLPAATLEKPPIPGLQAVVHEKNGNRRELIVEKLVGTIGEITKAGVTPESMRLTGLVNVGQPGVYQLAVRSNGRLRITVQDRVLMDEAVSQDGAERFVVLGLEAGWHPIEIELKPGGKNSFLKVVLAGDQVPDVLGKGNLAH